MDAPTDTMHDGATPDWLSATRELDPLHRTRFDLIARVLAGDDPRRAGLLALLRGDATGVALELSERLVATLDRGPGEKAQRAEEALTAATPAAVPAIALAALTARDKAVKLRLAWMLAAVSAGLDEPWLGCAAAALIALLGDETTGPSATRLSA